MIINQIDAQFQYEGVTYTIGGKVCANDAATMQDCMAPSRKSGMAMTGKRRTAPRTSIVRLWLPY